MGIRADVDRQRQIVEAGVTVENTLLFSRALLEPWHAFKVNVTLESSHWR